MKTHLLTKKRALISSVAMLLVAIIALGTATFAWFTSNTKATATGINVRTQKVSELEISSKLKPTYTTTFSYDVGTTGKKQMFMPASTVNGTAWFTAIAEKANNYATKNDGTDISAIDLTDIDDSKNFNAYIVSDNLNIHNKGKADCDNVKVTISGIPSNYLRIALVPVTEKNGTSFKYEQGKSFKDYVYSSDGESYLGLSGKKVPVKPADAANEITPNTDLEIPVGKLSANGAEDGSDCAYFKLFVWFEGQDPDCKNANSGDILDEITLTVTGEAVTDTNA